MKKYLFLMALPLLTLSACGGSNGQKAQIEDLIIVDTPLIDQTVSSPLTVSGEARGTYFFEGSFPVYLEDENNNQLAIGLATSTEEWMTEDFIPFEATLNFVTPEAEAGVLILERDNPSGLPENDASLSVPVRF